MLARNYGEATRDSKETQQMQALVEGHRGGSLAIETRSAGNLGSKMRGTRQENFKS